MTRYADPERCPDCRSAMPYGATRCPSCGLPLEGPLASDLFATLSHADDLLLTMRAQAATPVGAAPVAAGTVAGRPGEAPQPAASLLPPQGASPETTGPATAVLPGPPRIPGPPAPPTEHRRPGGLGGASVPKILLGLGALCLLVAALVFLAVTWSAMGVAGRTATLVGFTLVAGGLTWWAARRDLRAAAESLGVVALGLMTFDLFGARDAGWLGDLSTSGFFVVLGTLLALVGTGAALAVRRTPASALVGAELVAALGVATAVAGASAADWLPWSAAITLAVLVAAAVAFAANTVRLTVLSVAASLVAIGSWMLLAMSSVQRAFDNPSLRELWLELEVWPLLVTAALAAGLVLVRGLPLAVRLVTLGVAAFVLAVAALAPLVDETATEGTLAGAVLLVAVAVLALVVPQPWRRSLAGAGAPGLAWMLLTAVALSGEALVRTLDRGAALWAGTPDGSFGSRDVADFELAGWLLPVVVVAAAVALVAAARSFTWAERAVAPLAGAEVLLAVAAGALALTLALYPTPVWAVLAVLLVTGAAFTALWLRRQRPVRVALAGVFLAPALQLSLHDRWLTLVALLVLLGAAATVHLRAARLELSVAAGVPVAAALGGLVWTVGALVDADGEWTALVALLVLAARVLGGPYVDRRLLVSGPAGLARVGVELGALATAAVVGAAGVDAAPDRSAATWLAVYLTLAGAAVTAMALLRPDRRRVGWLGGLLLVAASWVRLADLGVETPEAYTLPAAFALLVVGLHRLRHDPGTSTMAALSAGLGLALVPSLLWVLVDPVALRSVILGAAALGLVVAGVQLRWSAPLVHGAVIGAAVALRHAVPFAAEAVPRWALIGAAGVLLVAMGITWEARVRDARRVAGYVRGLR